MARDNIKAFSLIELIVVIIILGILAAISIPAFQKTQERAFDNDAKASLKLIQSAEKIYRLETGFYYPPGSTDGNHSTINTNLRLSLPVTTSKWNYTVDGTTGESKAVRSGGTDIRTWELPIDQEDPSLK